jgi:phage tail-like protein
MTMFESGRQKAGAPGKDMPTPSVFSLIVDGQDMGPFTQLSGITSEVEAIEYMESGESGPTFGKRPSRAKPARVILKRNFTTRRELWAWHEAVRAGKIPAAAKDCELALRDATGQTFVSYHLMHAWPSKVEISGVKTGDRMGDAETLIETVTMVAEEIRQVS